MNENEKRLVAALEAVVDLCATPYPLIGFRCRHCWEVARTPPLIIHKPSCQILKIKSLLLEVRGY
jgi:hypothetical protein